MNFLLGGGEWENSKFLIVNLSVPKFDVSSDLNLNKSLQALGVTDVFDSDAADFSPVIENADGVFLSRAEHAARVAIDEEGVTAAAYTVMMEAARRSLPTRRSTSRSTGRSSLPSRRRTACRFSSALSIRRTEQRNPKRRKKVNYF